MRATELIIESESFISQGDLEQATEKLNHALIVDPKNSDAKRKLLAIHIEKDETEYAFDLVCELLQDLESDIDLLNIKASCLVDLDRLDESLELFNSIIQDSPDFYLAYGGRGVVYFKFGEIDNALKDLNFAIKHTKKNGYLYLHRSVIYIEQEEYKKALRDLDKALRLDKNIDEARLNRAVVLRLLGEKEKALRDFDRVSNDLQFDSETYLQKGIVYLKNKDYIKALEYHDLAIENDPSNVEAIYSRSIVYCEMKEFENSISDIKRAESIAPYDFMDYILNMYAFVNYRMKNFEKAIDYAEKTLKEFPNFFWANLTLAEIYGELSEKEAFYNNLQIAISGGIGFEDIDINIRNKYSKDKEFKKLTKSMKRIGPYG
jgi:tetratricopeptide (TPR) repeat protein